MKSLSVSELDKIVEQLKALVGARLQDIKVLERDLVLGFWGSDGLKWVWLDLSPHRPMLLILDELPKKVKEKTKPIKLFIKANVLNQRLDQVTRPAEYGRVVKLMLSGGEKQSEIEFRLFPHGQNILVHTGQKSLSWSKPKELAPLTTESHEEMPPREYHQIVQQWLDEKSGKAPQRPAEVSKDQAEKQLQRLIKKKKKAISKVEEDLQAKREAPWRAIGEWVKTHQSLDVPEEWRSYIDSDQSLSDHIEFFFQKAKDTEGKQDGTAERLSILKQELHDLEQVKDPQAYLRKAQAPRSKSKERTKNVKYKGRSLTLSSQVEAVIGKSAADNLKLLRRARPWDIWLHLKDFPGSHGFIFRNKKTTVDDEEIRKVGSWLVETTFGDKAKGHKGEKFDMLVTECRYVRPIKGDRLGRVNYSNERVLTVTYT